MWDDHRLLNAASRTCSTPLAARRPAVRRADGRRPAARLSAARSERHGTRSRTPRATQVESIVRAASCAAISSPLDLERDARGVREAALGAQAPTCGGLAGSSGGRGRGARAAGALARHGAGQTYRARSSRPPPTRACRCSPGPEAAPRRWPRSTACSRSCSPRSACARASCGCRERRAWELRARQRRHAASSGRQDMSGAAAPLHRGLPAHRRPAAAPPTRIDLRYPNGFARAHSRACAGRRGT